MALALFRFGAVIRYAVDIPLLDEWDMIPFIAENAQEFDWRSFLRIHNDHRILFTRLTVYAAYLLNGWNIPFVLALNYVLYLAMVGMLITMCAPSLRISPPYPLLFVPLFSDYVWMNMVWSFQSQFHFMILFALCAIWFGLTRPPTWGNTALFALFSGLSIFSMSPTCVIGIWGVYLLTMASRANRDNWPRQATLMGVATGVIAVLIIAFFSGHSGVHLEGQPGFTLLYPWNRQFWSYVFKTLANVFGAKLYRRAPWLAFVVGPAMGLVLIRAVLTRRKWDLHLFAPLAVISASLVSLAAIAYGRGCMEPMARDRHMEVLLCAFPALWAIGSVLSRRKIALASLWFVCAITLIGYATYLRPRTVPIVHDYLLAGRSEIIAFAQGKKSQVDSGLLYPENLSRQVLLARQLNLSFTRDIPGAIWDQAGNFPASAPSRNGGAAVGQNPP